MPNKREDLAVQQADPAQRAPGFPLSKQILSNKELGLLLAEGASFLVRYALRYPSVSRLQRTTCSSL